MTVKETIACIGGGKRTDIPFLKRLAQAPLHLLFISNGETTKEEVLNQLGGTKIQAEIDWMECAKEGCWEADMIIFINLSEIEPVLLDRIKEVATQKIVLCISTEGQEKKAVVNAQVKTLRGALPHSKITGVLIEGEEAQVEITGKDPEAIGVITDLFDGLGYRAKRVEF